ncbi:L,D-transpeptidase family protein [Photobacterium sp. SDRW27]|uniref:L,D-transpeptidase family protein n=1 Tax=Photobacterium obscurum TaxID=2829490 RepID=UPI002243DA86|nr:L,D-transpeptidase family protein [Photobacterium obscurum]MCW8327256.1 L,D-transpeptidase family protein [Photobacterium obscurum]
MVMAKLCSLGLVVLVASMQSVSAEILQPSQPLSVVSVQPQHAETVLQQQKAELWVSEIANNVTAIRYIDKLAQLYHGIGYTPVWQDTFASDEFEEQLRLVALSGVSSDFARRYSLLKYFKRSSDWRQYDLLATDSLLAYMSYAESLPEFGRGWLFGAGVESRLPPPSLVGMDRLLGAIEEDRLRYFLNGFRPADDRYRQIQLAIQQMEQVTEHPWPRLYQPGLIRLGARLDNPDGLITILENLGDLKAYEAEQLRSSGVRTYNIDLARAVRSFQLRHGLKVDGIIGPKTRFWLAMPPQERIRILALNAQRLRLWPVDNASILIVNIPGYGLSLWLDNEHVLDSKVIVGRPSRRTPLMTSTVASVVFNPYWNVPISIMRKDILPKARYDRGYLYRNDFAVIRSWTSSEQIPIHTIDWRIVNAKSFPYRLRQKPGKKNALGRFKFNIPNNNSIYLHDTPAKSLFEKEERAFSSGCIRVEHADDLAMILLTYSGVPELRINELKARAKTKTVGLGNKVGVQVIYQTAWVDNQGLVNFREDVYSYDQVGGMSQKEEKLTKIYNE